MRVDQLQRRLASAIQPDRAIYAVFGAAVLGYMLSLIALPKIAHARRQADWVSIKNSGAIMSNEKNLRIAAGYAG